VHYGHGSVKVGKRLEAWDGSWNGKLLKVCVSIRLHVQYGPNCSWTHLRKLHKSSFVIVLNIMLCSLDANSSTVHTTALDKRQERCYPWKCARIVCSVSTLWLPDLHSSQHCREQWTGVTPSLVRALNIYSKVC